MASNNTKEPPPLKDMATKDECTIFTALNVGVTAMIILAVIFVILLCNSFHALLKRFNQHRIVSQVIFGLILGNIKAIYIRGPLKGSLPQTLKYISEFTMICYMFVLGLEMEPLVLLQRLTREARVAYAGIAATIILTFIATNFLPLFKDSNLEFTLGLCIFLASTSSPVLTRFITSLKIGKSDIGKFVVAAGVQSDLVCTLFLCIGYLFLPRNKYFDSIDPVGTPLQMAAVLIIQVVVATKVGPVFLKWVNSENPEGKPLKGSHLVLSIAFFVLICGCSTLVQYNSILSAFISGLCLPRQGRISKVMVSMVNYFLNTMAFLILFTWGGIVADVTKLEIRNGWTWEALLVLFLIATVGKVFGTVVSGILLGFHWPESVAIGLLLAVKGHFHMFLAFVAIDRKLTTVTIGIIIIIVNYITIIYAPSVVAHIIKRARKRSWHQKMTLQWLDPLSELRILIGLHGLHNVPSTVNFMEISRGTADPGIMVYCTDMIEVTEPVAAATVMVQREGMDAVTLFEEAVTEMREQINNSLQSYVEENGNGNGNITVRRMLALSTMNNMHQDVCTLAEDLMVSLIILPFQNYRLADGSLEKSHPGFRSVNRKVLRRAPCSVGILVDRGIGLINEISRSHVSLNAGVIFIGGKDDREALAYASHVAQHPGVRLTVIRFLEDTNEKDTSTTTPIRRVNIAEQEEEMRVDNECFADFYERQVAAGYVAYMEKHLANSAETFSTLRSLEGQYELLIVGRGARVNSVLTAGMSDWEQCPELGPIGDILSSTHFSSTASILIIQQHSLKGEIEGLDDEFSIM